MKIANTTTLGTQYGDRKLKIIAADIDELRNKTTLHELDVRMNHMDVDILRIQETRHTQSMTLHAQEYISVAAKSKTGIFNDMYREVCHHDSQRMGALYRKYT